MPATSPAQQRFMGYELNKVRSGGKSDTGMTETQLDEFAHKPPGGYQQKSGGRTLADVKRKVD